MGELSIFIEGFVTILIFKPTFLNLVKSQIPLIMVYENISRSIFDFVSRQSEFAFFGAVNFGCRTFYFIYFQRKKYDLASINVVMHNLVGHYGYSSKKILTAFRPIIAV